MKIVSLYLPFPPSVNGLFATNWKTKRRFPTKKYEEWKVEAEGLFWKQKHLVPEKFINPVKVTISLERPDKRKRDVANYEKAVTDFLVKMGVLEDDSLIHSNTQEWCRVITDCLVTVEEL